MKGSTAAARVTSAVDWEVWGQHVAIAAAYVGFYEICRHLSVTQWMLMSGLRLTCMVLLPTCYWPALVLGEELPLLENALLWGHKFGVLWALLAAVPMARPTVANTPVRPRTFRLKELVLLPASFIAPPRARD